MTEHTAKAFDVDLQELDRMVAEMGGLARLLPSRVSTPPNGARGPRGGRETGFLGATPG